MVPNLYRYTLDLSGVSTDNFVTGETHAIGTAPVRAFATDYGAFFSRSVEIVDAFTLKPLTRLQYAFQFLHEEATLRTGQSVYAVVVITDPEVGPNVGISYQALGGEYSQPMVAIADEITTLAMDNRGVEFGNITGKPDTYPPVPHLHAIGDTYDWDYVVAAIEMILNAISMVEASSYDATLSYIDQQANLRAADIGNFAQQLNAHITNYRNPHQVTLTQVDVCSIGEASHLIAVQTAARIAADHTLLSEIAAHAGNTANPHQDTAADIGGYTSTQADANLAVIVAALDTTLSRDAQAMAAHIANTANPHQVTLQQINALSTGQINAAISAAMSPISTQLAADEATLAAHIANTNNPHQVTLSQINGWDSANISAVDAEVNDHITNTSNPHNVTCLQVGTQTVSQITGNISNNLVNPAYTSYLTPCANTVNGHLNNFNNPHDVTVAQLGGWTYAQWQAAGQAAVAALSV